MKRLLINFLLLGRPGLRKKSSILMYHSVDTRRHYLTVSPAALDKQLAYLKDNRRVVPLRELIDRLIEKRGAEGLVAITFDDGYENFYTEAWPLLKKYNLPATVFVPTGLLGKEFYASDSTSWTLMTEGMVREIKKVGLVEFMPHTQTHTDLARVPKEEYEREIEMSQNDLQEILGGEKETIFAFPKGKFLPGVIDFLKSTGWRAAVGVRPGLADTKSDMYDLPRNGVGDNTSIKELELLVSDRLDWYLGMKKLIIPSND